MAQPTKIGTTKRLGVRYGRKLRERVGVVESEMRKRHVCPSCKAPAVKRVSVGIWQCRKCNHKFTSKAYTVAKMPSIKAPITDEDLARSSPQVAVQKSPAPFESELQE
jgi:large subunit ribosomal protein L37Ae